MSRQVVQDIYDRLYRRFGPQHWWPGDTPFEIIIGAILTQNTNWGNVKKAIDNLKKNNLLTPEKLYRLDIAQLAELIRPAGYYNIKAGRLKSFLNRLFENFDGDLDRLSGLSTDLLREELLFIKGIGPETTDSICLYAFNKPVFVVDAYTGRILGRHRLIEPGAGYEEIRTLFESALPKEPPLYNEYHALLVRLGKDFCKTKPQCKGCPLEDLPHDIEPV
ncbi:MAG: endonuclease III domain-containing protein [Planctomycetes bacterium]|nr:endonuclease III domain-containing protein [Planctomycetota bacterium]